ncbi:MAG: hypothetical protein K9J27_00750 [Bacteroidales bacterium]|nr:hypothetical protein [Bacteroidales bacterium]MCF8333129.1 hypothetical protein [Bacteroidales bacterium]
MKQPTEFYTAKQEETNQLLTRLQKTSKRQSLLRVLFFLLAVVALYVLVEPQPIGAGVLSAFFFGLLIFIARRHHSTQNKIKRAKMLKSLTVKELKAMEGDFEDFINGLTHLDKNHPYAFDLDIFGEGSLFQRLNRTFSDRGSAMLAQRLTDPFKNAATIKKVQQGVKELSSKPQWMLDFRTVGELISGDSEKQNLISFFKTSYPQFRNNTIKYLLFALPALTLVMIALTVAGIVSFSLFVLYVLVFPIGVTAMYLNTITLIHNKLGKQTKKLQQYRMLLEYLETEKWKSEQMQQFQHSTQSGGKKASVTIQSLSAILEQIDYRLNLIAGIIMNVLFLWDIRMVRKLEFWKEQHAAQVERYLHVINEVEVIVSQATFYYNHPGYAFPEPTEQVLIQATNAGHPFINSRKRVDNPVDYTAWGEFKVITGGNMAGKSTYLRTIGINLILAMSGNPVCAGSFRFSPMTLVTSIRSDDSLQENESLFYAELKKLRDIIQRLESGEKLFLLLDEILKGTNSEDKRKGSLALLRQLLRYKTSGAIATHDLAVGGLAGEFPEFIQNYCFEIEIDEKALHFDYKLRKGVARNLNATFLMKRMGITVEDRRDA